MAGLNQRDFAKELKKSQVWLQKVLGGENHVRLRDLDDVARAMRTTASELVRLEEERYRLELTPTEVRIVEQLRRLPHMFAGVAQILHIPAIESAKDEASTHVRPRAADRSRSRSDGVS